MDKETLTFHPHISMNDYIGLASALAAGAGIGELPPVVQPGLIREGRLVEVIPDWRFRTYDLSLVQIGTATSPSHAGSSRISRCKWRQVCFPTCRRERRTQPWRLVIMGNASSAPYVRRCDPG
jgi:DNA-binding transcriptional LysR family regulator